MDVLRIDNLYARRAIRSYTHQPVRRDDIETLLKAAMSAPSAGNRQPYHLVVVTDPATREALTRVHPSAQMLLEAPVCIVPVGEPALSFPDAPEYWIQDASAATENLLLAATSLGLGTCWCGVLPIQARVEAVRKVLGIPANCVPLALIAVGYPAEDKPPRVNYKPAKVHWEKW